MGGSDGYFETNVIGGIPPYYYAWSNGGTVPDIYNLPSGTYSLTVVDANGCQNSFYATLYEPNNTQGGPIIDTLYTTTVDSCLNFVPDSFSVASISFNPGEDTVIVVWDFINGGQTTTFTANYIYAQSGNYMVMLAIICGTKSITTYQSYIHIQSPMSVSASDTDKNLWTYPVPFKDVLNITFTLNKTSEINISLVDATGRIVENKKVSVSTGVNSTEINTTNLPSGVYILNLENNGQVLHKQVVK